MQTRISRALLVVVAILCVDLQGHELMCGSGLGAAAPASGSETRKYTPERQVDVTHLALDVMPNFQERSVEGTATIRFKALPKATSELTLHAEDLRVAEVTGSAPIAGYFNSGKEIVVTFNEPLGEGTEHTISIRYKAFPKKGLYFRTPEMGFKSEDQHLFTQGESVEARHWYPSYDAPGEKFTSEITCRVPEEMTVLSNGKMVSEEKVVNGLKAVRWLQEKPHVNYLLSLIAGNFKRIEDEYRGIPLAFYTPSSEIDYARNSFRDTKDMMEFFEKEIGVKYPWEKYYQVCVHDFGWGGMENTSVTTLNNRTLFPDETENIRSSQGLVAHELAHQWFGDLVTCEDWSQIWLNEGFATYYAHLYTRHKEGQDHFLYGMYHSAERFINYSSKEDSRPVVFRSYEEPTDLFGYLVYPKGGWVLHMLRNQMREELFRKAVTTYLERHQFDSVDTHDLIEAVEEVSGKSWDAFFDQWIFHPHHPELKVRYSWDQKSRMAKVSVDQVQEFTNGIGAFRFPVTVRFKGKFGTVDKQVEVNEKSETYYMALSDAPELVRIDPEYSLLAKVDFELPRAMLLAQLKDESDVMGRIFAVQQLAKSKDADTVKELGKVLREDPFYGVRVEAAQALRKAGTKDALEMLIASAEQSDARVRQSVVMAVGGFYDPAAMEFALASLEKEKNPDILFHAIRSLGGYPGSKLNGRLASFLQTKSYQNILAEAAISAMKAQNDPEAVGPLLEVLEMKGGEFTANGYGAALEAVAYLGRDEKRKDSAYEFLLKHSGHQRLSIQLAAIAALGTLQDERAIPVLTKFVEQEADWPTTQRAERALAAIRNSRKVVNEVETLRSEVIDVKRENEELRKTLDDLQKKVEAIPAPAGKDEKPEKKWWQ